MEGRIDHFDANPRRLIPMGRIIKFPVASAMRREEICRVTWSDRIPLLAVSGYAALAVIEEQRAIRSRAGCSRPTKTAAQIVAAGATPGRKLRHKFVQWP